jgi:IclR helix-turn-helix domain
VLARDLGLPRSTTYHLLAELIAAGFVVHLPEERRYGLGVSAFEIGSAYARQEPLARLARPVLARLVDAVGHSAHLAVLHGREVLYVVEQRAPGRPPLVTDVGVRLPAQLTASGKAMLADLPGPHVRALFPTRARSSTRPRPARRGARRGPVGARHRRRRLGRPHGHEPSAGLTRRGHAPHHVSVGESPSAAGSRGIRPTATGQDCLPWSALRQRRDSGGRDPEHAPEIHHHLTVSRRSP